ncbi:MAG: hypothetical protein WCT35_02315 [Sideroxydans sp.]
MKYLFLLSLLVLAGCASSQLTKGPNGEDAYLVKCGNAVKSKCVAEANSLCPKGYVQLDWKPDSYADSTKVGNIGVLEVRADTTTTMLIQCNR